MKKDDTKNEYIGIITLIVIVFLAIIGIYFYFTNLPPIVTDEVPKSHIYLKNPAPN